MNSLRQGVCLLSPLFLTFWPGCLGRPSRCHAADPTTEPPYQLKVVLDVARSRVLTRTFRDQVERELQEGLQAALGDLAIVEVTREHPKLADIRERGLGKALDAWKGCSPVKTHFVLIDLVNNQYEIQTRQYDGPTGTPGPVVRVERTPDRAFVARAATLMIERDFGFTATFASWPAHDDASVGPQPVQLSLKGANLGVPLSRWVSKDDIFAVVHMYKGSDNRAPELIPWCLVQVQDPPQDDSMDGLCTGRLFWRYRPPSEGQSHEGYRCIKLGAIRGPIKLRLVKQSADKSAGPLQATLEVRRLGFKGEEASMVPGGLEQGTGLFSTEGKPNIQPYDKVAFITVRSGGKIRAYLPLPILDDHTVVVPFSANTDQVDALAQRIDRWQRHVDDAWRVQNAVFQDLNALLQRVGTPREKIIDRAKAGRERTIEDYGRLIGEKEELPRDLGPRKSELKRLEAVLQDLQKGEKQLTDFVEKQEKIFKEESSPERKTARAQFEDARLAEDKAEYEQAIDLYKKALAVINDPAAKKQLEDLEAKWKPLDKNHIRARKFIYETWPNLDTRGLESEMEAAGKALEECKSAGDRLTPRKLVLATRTHVNRLRQERDELKPDVRESDQKPLERIVKVGAELQKLMSDALEYLKSGVD
jgi:tetratricopeptide (TPR) repeat protein